MCGIVGYIGARQAPAICVAGLRRLEYRGYDSAGVAVATGEGIGLRRVVGKLHALETALGDVPLGGTLGIGHTRWATHGKPSVENSHPHVSADGRIAIVHNGIIENYRELRERLQADGFAFKSETDSEVMAHLVQTCYEGDLREAVRRAVHELRGAFAFGVICADSPGELVAVRRRSPLVVGLGAGENFIASDMPAIRAETDRVYVIDDDEIARVTAEGIELTALDGARIEKSVYHIPWPVDAAAKGGHEHFMHKEIHEQPDAMHACLAGRLTAAGEPVRMEGLNLDDDTIRSARRIVFTACGTAFHAGLVGQCAMETWARVPSEAYLAAELHARDAIVLEDTLVIAVSQSGETMDTLLAMRDMQAKGAKVVSVLNVVDSTIARESDGTVYIQAGPEIGVASTKAYTLQILTIELLALYFAQVRGTLPDGELRAARQALLDCPEKAAALIGDEPAVRALARRYYDLRRSVWEPRGIAIHRGDDHAGEEGCWAQMRRRDAMRPNALYIARGVNLATALEGALKLKEISYLNAEGYSAGEMKHGPIALVEPAMFTVAVAVEGVVRDQMLANITEIKARGGPVIVLATEGDEAAAAAGVAAGDPPNDVLYVPRCPELVSPILAAIPLQLLAYHIADLRGEHIDQPRNLAKTVTVE